MGGTKGLHNLEVFYDATLYQVSQKMSNIWFDITENDCVYMTSFYIFWILIRQLKVDIKQSKIGWKFVKQ